MLTAAEEKIAAMLDELHVPAHHQPPDDPETGVQPMTPYPLEERLALMISRYGENLQQYDAALRHAHASNVELATVIKKTFRYLERGHVLNAKARLGEFVRRIRLQEEGRKKHQTADRLAKQEAELEAGEPPE